MAQTQDFCGILHAGLRGLATVLHQLAIVLYIYTHRLLWDLACGPQSTAPLGEQEAPHQLVVV